MKIIIGLGNPGDKYKNTRHNIGFMFLNFFAEKYNFSEFLYESKFRGSIATGKINMQKILLLKPETFMNLSGESLRKVFDFYKLDISDILVIYDDISLEFGKIRFRQKGSHGGHNGIRNITRHIKGIFDRIKIGIGHNIDYEISDWVLSKFTEEELIDIDNKIFPEVEKIVIEKYNFSF